MTTISYGVHNMNKKQISILVLLLLVVSALTACTVNSGSGNISTTAITDTKGQTHIYESVTDDNGNISTTNDNQGVFAEIETKADGKVVTKKDGTYVTNEHTTILTVTEDRDKATSGKNKEKSTATTKPSLTNVDSKADNDVPFETTSQKSTTTTTTEETQASTSTTKSPATTTETDKSTTEKTTQVVTDEDGWINKWY